MKAIDSLPSGFAPREPWSHDTKVDVRPARSAEVLAALGEGRERVWALNPYSGCELACTFCAARQLSPFKDADLRLFERDIHARTNAAEAVARALRSGALDAAPLLLGTTCDPWQPAERVSQVTRSALDVLARFGKVDLWAMTRSTLAPRDADLLSMIGRQGRARVVFSIGTLDLRLSRLLEPLAPTPDRRLVAMEALARAGVEVGLAVSPVLAGLNDALPALEGLLRRASSAGARFAWAESLSMPKPARAKLVRHVSHFDPELATRYDRLLARSVEHDPHAEERLQARFDEACGKVGMPQVGSPAHALLRRAAVEGETRQLSLF
jgi:DNA repair photolyase